MADRDPIEVAVVEAYLRISKDFSNQHTDVEMVKIGQSARRLAHAFRHGFDTRTDDEPKTKRISLAEQQAKSRRPLRLT